MLKYTQDVDEQAALDFALSMVQTVSQDSDKKIIKQKKNRADNLQDGFVELCSPVQLYVVPKSGPC